MKCYEYMGKAPRFAPTARAAESAIAAGDVELAEGAALWHGAVLRGDHDAIRVGERSNIQDNAVVHMDTGHPVRIGADVTVGHGAIVHGCTIGDACIIGMGAVLMNGCVIGEGSLVAAGALVTQGKVIPPRSLVVGSPAKVLRALTDEEYAGNLASAEEYRLLAEQSLPLAGSGESE